VIRQFGHISDAGRLHIRNARVFFERIRRLTGKDVEIRIKPIGDKPTHRTHKYYRGGVLPTIRLALEEYGYLFSDEEVHEYLKRKFLTETRFNEKNQKEYTVIFSTAEINQESFNRYIEKCREFALDSLETYVLSGDEYQKKNRAILREPVSRAD